MLVEISKRKLESYKRAEKLAREVRYQLSHAQRQDLGSISDFVIYWMRSTGNIAFKRPKKVNISLCSQ
jgi:hypothetical protein